MVCPLQQTHGVHLPFAYGRGKKQGATLGWGNLENRKGQKNKDVVGKEMFILSFSEGFYKQWSILKKTE